MGNLIYERIISLISEKKLTKAKVENAANLGNGTIETWKTGNPTISKLEAVAKVLEVPVSELVKEDKVQKCIQK